MGTSIELADIAQEIPHDNAAFYQETIADLLRDKVRRFPGAQPVSFSRKHLRELTERDYFLVEKTDGLRCLLYCHQIDGDNGLQEAQFLIDRKNKYWFIQSGYLHIPPPSANPQARPPYDNHAWHLNTLLDGELVRQKWPNGKEQLTFLIFDILTLDGENITQRDYGQRIAKIERSIIKPWEAFAKDWPDEAKVQPFQLALKRPQAPYGAEMMFKEVIPKLPHGNDGLIFTCKDTGYVCGTDEHILKWKPPHENTVDFRLRLGMFPMDVDENGEQFEDFDGKPEIELLVWHGNKKDDDGYQKFADLHLEDAEWEAMKSMQQMFDWRIMECWRDSVTGKWRPKIEKDGTPRFRDDKEQANHVSVVQSVIESIEDAVSEEELIRSSERIRSAWKERERRAKVAQQQQHQQQQQQHHQQQQQQHHQQQQQQPQQRPAAPAPGPPPPPQQQARTVSVEEDGPGYAD